MRSHDLRVAPARSAPAWLQLTSFADALEFWADQWRTKNELERLLEPRSMIALRARVRAYWEACDERNTHPEPDMDVVVNGLRSMLEHKLRVETTRVDAIYGALDRFVADEAKPRDQRKPLLTGLCEILEAGTTKPTRELTLVMPRKRASRTKERPDV